MKRAYKNNRLRDSFKNSIRGFWYCLKSERNMRIHTVAAIYVLFFAPKLNVSSVEYALLFLLIALIISAEAFNTAIEKLSDYICSYYSRQIGFIKDISAAAVFILAVISVVIAFLILYKPDQILETALTIWGSTPRFIAFLSSLALSFIFVFYGPVGIKRWFHKKKRK